MKSTSLTTVIITVAAMAGIVIASGDGPDIPCSPYTGGCSGGVKNYNNGNAFGYICGPDGHITAWYPCSCPTCCGVTTGLGMVIPGCTTKPVPGMEKLA
ncbi:hypothetical protein DFJ58DRAFT_218117 [Suillus subalutaceus]|uniref:uncharacterized protein n=1 Tax=Suillus subalutaceus TaxID=48586 RepID=UPI001B86E720|nr:uncharacterized protein DFJ58DRAFT_218117 [Suillus subalutaceus]KAG1834336.1 hypothetical protein DFJ58DRAFT_218117 [Suillus subalutaceus]